MGAGLLVGLPLVCENGPGPGCGAMGVEYEDDEWCRRFCWGTALRVVAECGDWAG